MTEETNIGGGGESGGTSEGTSKAQGFRARLEDLEKTVRIKVEEADRMLREAVRSAVPEDVARHMSNSKREFLLGIRKIIDRELEKSEKTEQKNDSSES